MGFVLVVRLRSFFTGCALVSGAALYYLRRDYVNSDISQQINSLYEVDVRLTSLEKLNEAEAPKHVEAVENPKHVEAEK